MFSIKIQSIRFSILTSITLISISSFGQDTSNTELKKRIYKIYQLDQECRTQLRKFYNNEIDTSAFSIFQIKKQIRETDSLNYFKLMGIIDEYGFPGYDIVGEDFSNAFWNIVQHQDNNLEFQQLVLEKMKIEVDKNNASATYYAYLMDRVLINLGEKQIYGTQLELNSNSTSYELKPTTEIENLNIRRKDVNLNSIEEYIETMNSRYHGTIEK